MEKIVEQGLLYDFYGELLTDHQRHVYEDVVFNDMSLSEIAEEQGISRQGVHDLIKRCDRILAGYEEKLRMVEKFNQTKRMVEEIKTLAGTYKKNGDMSLDVVSGIEVCAIWVCFARKTHRLTAHIARS